VHARGDARDEDGAHPAVAPALAHRLLSLGDDSNGSARSDRIRGALIEPARSVPTRSVAARGDEP
jgi:hypothetical protein